MSEQRGPADASNGSGGAGKMLDDANVAHCCVAQPVTGAVTSPTCDKTRAVLTRCRRMARAMDDGGDGRRPTSVQAVLDRALVESLCHGLLERVRDPACSLAGQVVKLS